MVIYSIILICIKVGGIGYLAGNDEEKECFISIGRLIVLLPIFGRIFGWW